MIHVGRYSFHEGSRIHFRVNDGGLDLDVEMIVESQDPDGTLHLRAPVEGDPLGLTMPDDVEGPIASWGPESA